MHILLNGERRELPGPRTVRALLEELGIDARVVAVEVNRTVIRRAQHDLTLVTDGAEVEIVSFVGGGTLSDSMSAGASAPAIPRAGMGRGTSVD
jgi:sulfur carrier protein